MTMIIHQDSFVELPKESFFNHRVGKALYHVPEICIGGKLFRDGNRVAPVSGHFLFEFCTRLALKKTY